MKPQSYYRLIAIILIIFLYFIIPNQRPDFTKFNAHDSGSYVALSYNLVNGNGYTRNITADSYIPHTLWPPGMAILLAPSLIISGEIINWFAVKSTIILTALLGILFLWLYVFRVSNSKITADIVTIFIALNPFYWHFSHLALAEIPVMTWIFASLFIIDVYWSKKPIKTHQAFVIGLLVGLGMMFKGILLGLVLAPLAYLMGPRKTDKTFKGFAANYLIYTLAFCIPFILWSQRNHDIDTTGLGLDGVDQIQMILKVVPEDPTSRFRSLNEITQTIKENIFWYGIYNIPSQVIPSIWLIDLVSISNGIYLALFLCFIILIFMIPFRFDLLAIYFILLPIFLLILPLSIGGSARYWFPISILSSILVLLQFHELYKRYLINKLTKKTLKILLSLFSLLITTNLVFYMIQFNNQPYGTNQAWSELAQLIESQSMYCQPFSSQSDVTVYSRNPYVFRLTTGCNSPMTNEYLKLTPSYTHAILNEKKISRLNVTDQVIKRISPWVFLKFPHKLTEKQISFRYNINR